MSQFPPTPPPYPAGPPQPFPPGQPGGAPIGYGTQQPPPPSAGNGMAVTSLILGILGCVPFLTGALAIVFGILGIKRSKQTQSGKGMAIAGVVLGAASILGWALFGGGVWALIKGTEVNRDLAGQFIRDLGSGKIDAAQAAADPSIDKAALETLSQKMVTGGGVLDVTSNSINVSNGLVELKGVVKFTTGEHKFAMEQRQVNGQWKVTFIRIGD